MNQNEKVKIKYFQIMSWIPDYVSLIDILGKFRFVGIIDYIPFFIPYIGLKGLLNNIPMAGSRVVNT